MALRILVIGDFSGTSERTYGLAEPLPIDLDNFDEVLRAVSPSVGLEEASLTFSELEDFHPDRLYATVGGLRDGALTPKQPSVAAPVAPSPATASAKPVARPSGGSLLDDLVSDYEEKNPAPVPTSLEDADDLSSFLRRVTAGHIAEPDSDADGVQNVVKSTKMRSILHRPDVQALEAAWRALYFLLRGADRTAKVYILDVTLTAFVKQLPTLQTKLQARGPWQLMVGNFYFGQTDRDAAALTLIGNFAQTLGATFLSGAVLSDDENSEQWQKLRHSALAPHIGLVLPRFLLRLPYGKGTVPIDSFGFEEMPESDHDSYLWANGAFAAAYLIARAYDDSDRNWSKRLQRQIEGLPLHVYESDGEHTAKPCAEMLITEKEAGTLLSSGLMPLASLKNQDAVLLVQFRSIAEPPASLPVLSE